MNPEEIEALAMALHEAGRGAVERGQTLAQGPVTVGNRVFINSFVEWADLPEHAREGRREMARWLLHRYRVVPQRVPLTAAEILAVPIERRPVASSQISSVGYDHAAEVLEVEFVGGALYRYCPVGLPIWRDLLASASKGRYFHAVIKAAPTYKVPAAAGGSLR